MKYYKNKENEIYAYDDDIKEKLLNSRIEKYGLVETTDEEIAEINLQKDLEYNAKNHTSEKNEISTLQSYLDSTDYIARKFTEYLVLGKNTNELLDEYSETFQMTNREVLKKSQEARDRINEIKVELGEN